MIWICDECGEEVESNENEEGKPCWRPFCTGYLSRAEEDED